MTAVRYTQRTQANAIHAHLQAGMGRTQRLQEKLASGRELTKPSDSPRDTAAALQERASIRRATQQVQNADDALGWLTAGDRALRGANDLMRRARELALQGGNAALGAPERAALATEVDALRDQMLSIANTEFRGRPIFAGTAGAGSTNRAYDAAFAYLGDAGAVVRSIGPGDPVQVNVTGTEAFGSPPADVFTVLANLAANLRTNPAALSTSDLPAIDTATERVKSALSVVGTRTNHVERQRDLVTEAKLDATTALSALEDADLAQTITELRLQEITYQAALGASSRALQTSLLDFLR